MPCTNHPVIEDNIVKCSRCSKPFCQDCVVQLKSNYYCIDCKGEQVKDIQSGADSTVLDLAGPGLRLAARMLDGLILMVPLYIVFFLLVGTAMAAGGGTASITIIVLSIVFFALVPLIYEAVMLQMRGQTLGKMICKVKVVTLEGNDISAGQAWGRVGSQILLSIIPYLGALGLLVDYLMIFSEERACLHDRMAKTRVIRWDK